MRVNAVPNGESKQRAVVVFGASMEEVREWRLYFFFCLLNHAGLPNHREITVWEIRRSLMCLKTLSKSGVGIYKLFFALHLYLLLFIFHVPYQEKKNRKRPFQPLDVLKISCTRRINYKACSRFTFWLAHQILWCDIFNVLYGPVRSIFFSRRRLNEEMLGCHRFSSVCLMFAHDAHVAKQSQLYLCETSFAVLSNGTIFPPVIQLKLISFLGSCLRLFNEKCS